MPTAIRQADAPAARARARSKRARRQARRLQAAALFAQDMRPAEVGRALGVSKQSASRWHTAWQRDGTAALTSKGPTGVKPRLCDADLRRVEQALLEGASAHGFTGELRTLARIGQLIQRLTGVRYHPGHLWAVLHQRLGWSVQRPLRRALERDEHAIARWVAQDWPRIKQAARRRKARIAPSSMSPGPACCQACAGPGRHAAIPRCCATGSTGNVSPWRPRCATGSAAVAPRSPSMSTPAATTPTASSRSSASCGVPGRGEGHAAVGRAARAP
jgi:transposase